MGGFVLPLEFFGVATLESLLDEDERHPGLLLVESVQPQSHIHRSWIVAVPPTFLSPFLVLALLLVFGSDTLLEGCCMQKPPQKFYNWFFSSLQTCFLCFRTLWSLTHIFKLIVQKETMLEIVSFINQVVHEFQLCWCGVQVLILKHL